MSTWIFPCNTDNFEVERAFDELKEIMDEEGLDVDDALELLDEL